MDQGIAIDIGANIGNHTIFLSKVCGMEVIAIEPFLQRWFGLSEQVSWDL